MAKTNDQQMVKASTIFLKLEKLSSEREKFEKTDLARTNLRLYELLADVYATYLEAKKERKILKLTVAEMKAAVEKDGSRVLIQTPTINLFVRFVFRSNRQTVHSYARAIEAAISDGVQPDDLSAYIVKQGGIQECKVLTMPSSKSIEKKKKIEAGMPLVDELIESSKLKPLAEFKTDPLLLEAIKNSEITILLGKKHSGGKVSVLTVVPAFRNNILQWAKEEMAQWCAEHQEHLKKSEKKNQAILAINDAALKAKSPSLQKQDKLKVSAASLTGTVGEIINS